MSETQAEDLVEECAKVVAQDASGKIWVSTHARSGCGRCEQPGGCGGQQASVLRMFARSERNLLVQMPSGAGDRAAFQPGEEVVIGVPGRLLLRAALVMYLLPLLGLLAGAVLGQHYSAGSDSEMLSIAGGFLGLLLGFIFARWWASQAALRENWLPRILRRVPVVGTFAPPH